MGQEGNLLYLVPLFTSNFRAPYFLLRSTKRMTSENSGTNFGCGASRAAKAKWPQWVKTPRAVIIGRRPLQSAQRKRIVDAKAQFRSLAEPWADTGTSTGCLMLAVLGGLTDVERDLIRTRPAQQKEATKRRAQGATLQELAESYDRSIATIRRATRDA